MSKTQIGIEAKLGRLIKTLGYTLNFGINLQGVNRYLIDCGFKDFGKCISHLRESNLIQETDVHIQQYFDSGEPLKENCEKMGRVALGNVFTRLPYQGCARIAQGIISPNIGYDPVTGLYFPGFIELNNPEELRKFVKRYRELEGMLRQPALL